MVADDFSFPLMPDPTPNDPSGTSLWRVPSGISLQSLNGDDDAGEEDDAIFETKGRMKDENGEEEKMDMLWENFNDGELLRRVSSPFDVKKGDEDQKLFWGSEFESKKSKRRRKCSTSTALTSPRRQNLVIILKMLKKLLLLQDSFKEGLGKTHNQNYKSA